MGAAINMADEKGCVTFSDRGTALQFKTTIDLLTSEFNDTIVDNPYNTSSFNQETQRRPTPSNPSSSVMERR